MTRAEINLDDGSYSVVTADSQTYDVDVCPEGADGMNNCFCASTCVYTYQTVRLVLALLDLLLVRSFLL